MPFRPQRQNNYEKSFFQEVGAKSRTDCNLCHGACHHDPAASQSVRIIQTDILLDLPTAERISLPGNRSAFFLSASAPTSPHPPNDGRYPTHTFPVDKGTTVLSIDEIKNNSNKGNYYLAVVQLDNNGINQTVSSHSLHLLIFYYLIS